MPQLSDDVILNMIELIEQKTDEVKRLKQELADAQENNHFIQSMCASMRKELNTLKSEVDRLSAFTTTTIIPNEHLQSQVERMTKAGDDLVSVLGEIDVVIDMDSDHPEVQAWEDAKKCNRP
jgi:chromosome segregation ATPase